MHIEFLKQIQAAGWRLISADSDGATVKCPSHGCGLRARLAPGSSVPTVCQNVDATAIPVTSYTEIRDVLREAREGYGLTIREVEEIAGVPVDHMAKAEKSDPTRTPNIQMFLEWAQALGFEVVLRPAPLGNYALRVISQTREKQPARKKRFALERKRRTTAAPP